MEVHLRDGERLALPKGSECLVSPAAYRPGSFAALAEGAMDAPLDMPPLATWNLKGKKVAVLIDDWGRPTPCSQFLPAALERLEAAGAERTDITIIAASGMHVPMNDADMERKVGKSVYSRYRCVAHDAGNRAELSFLGVTPLGTPVWVNRWATQADVRVSFGRVFPHICYGYEGGYKMIVPGIASFETIMRDHSLNFSTYSTYTSVRQNPSRQEADAVGRMVGIDMMVGFVMDWEDRPVFAYAGTVENTFARCVDAGQRQVWGAVCREPADITILSAPGPGREKLAQNPTYYLGMALNVTKPDGVILADMDYRHREKTVVEGMDLDEMPMEALYLLHEKRNWTLSDRGVQQAVKTIRGAFYFRRFFELRTQQLFFCRPGYPARLLEKWRARQFDDCGSAMRAALEQKGKEAHVIVIPDGAHTLPLTGYDFDTFQSNGSR